jgi:hypothetical protein
MSKFSTASVPAAIDVVVVKVLGYKREEHGAERCSSRLRWAAPFTKSVGSCSRPRARHQSATQVRRSRPVSDTAVVILGYPPLLGHSFTAVESVALLMAAYVAGQIVAMPSKAIPVAEPVT